MTVKSGRQAGADGVHAGPVETRESSLCWLKQRERMSIPLSTTPVSRVARIQREDLDAGLSPKRPDFRKDGEAGVLVF